MPPPPLPPDGKPPAPELPPAPSPAAPAEPPSLKSDVMTASPFGTSVSDSAAGEPATSVAVAVLLIQVGLEPGATDAHASPNACSEKVTSPVGRPLSVNVDDAPGTTSSARTSVRDPAAVTLKQFTFDGTDVTAKTTCPVLSEALSP